MTGLDHVLLHIGPEAVLRAEERHQPQAGIGGQTVGHVPEVAVNRGRVAHDAHAQARQQPRFQKAFRSEHHAHGGEL